ncbi:hypothetical protein [Bacillus sp. S/N-304-OC-R1]|uniref:hypothetical protein n=1 Tax=Bacillus sp. S/N-304-OC-R1 TaxID=2758034 RepID=UPI001C8F0E21|nr:hypothetical protein [Bacillus sp. S/N-304-OC-R1]MBY0120409.1 hypothetical protein [Bacillus sp. S/N-304-OC-R1]
MGLYSNDQIVPNLFNKQPQKASNSNQEYYRLNFLQEILEQQKLVNSQLSEAYGDIDVQVSESFKDFSQTLKRTSTKQNKDLLKLLNRLDQQEQVIFQFLEVIKQQENGNEMILDRLDELERRNNLILENFEKESLMNQALLDQVSFQHATTEALTGKLEKFESFSQDLSEQLDKQEDVYEELSKKLEVQEIFHTTVMERLNEQEAVVQKMTRQLENLRSTLYERVSHLSEKIETGFMHVLKPVQSFFIQNGEKSKKN